MAVLAPVALAADVVLLAADVVLLVVVAFDVVECVVV
jgi:hypothetical protein